MAMSKEERISELRREAIIAAAARHMDVERQHGTPVAVQHAISTLIGAAEFLKLRQGQEAAKDAVTQLHEAL